MPADAAADAAAQPARTALVIGAGAVGVSCALQMAKRGMKVTLIDRGPVGGGTSHGNAGAVLRAASPIAEPGVWRKVPSMLLDPMGPLTVRWRHLPALAPWLIRFLAESSPKRFQANSHAIWQLGDQAPDAWRRQVRGTTAEELLRPVGWLKVYETEKAFEEAAASRAVYAEKGAAIETFTKDELRQLEPNLGPIFARGALHADGLFARNPRRLVEICADAARALGVEILQAEAVDAWADDVRAQATLADGRVLEADRLVLAAGAWSKDLAARLGVHLPLDTERGYHLMFETPEKSLSRPVIWEEKSFVLCPMEHGLRMTSQVELAGLKAPPDYRRIESMIPMAQKMLPSLKDGAAPWDRWLGFRPSLPDARPLVGPSPSAKAALFAFGHQHYGLSLAARTGEVIADLAAGERPEIDLDALSPARWTARPRGGRPQKS